MKSERVETRAAQGATESRSEAYVRTPQDAPRIRCAHTRQGQHRSDATHIVPRRRFAHVAQSVERVLGKDEVSGSIPLVGSSFQQG